MSGKPLQFQPIECPVDFVPVNETITRFNAVLTLCLTGVWVLTFSPVIPAFLAIDFFLRSANYGRFSILNLVSGFLVKTLSIPSRPVDRAPKRFAAGVGAFFSVSILILAFIRFNLAAEVLAGILGLFASLEAFWGFCAGCYVYHFIKRLNSSLFS